MCVVLTCKHAAAAVAAPMPLNVMNSNKQMMVLVDNILLGFCERFG